MIVRDLDDGQMLQFMGRENGDDYNADFIQMLTTWEAVAEYIADHDQQQYSNVKMAEFLGWVAPPGVTAFPGIYNPIDAAGRVAKADAVIAYAKRVKDWDMLENAVDSKLDELTELVAWWNETVSPGESIGRGGHESVRDRRPIMSAKEAEKSTGFTKQQISDTRERLEDRAKWRDRIIKGARKPTFDEGVNRRNTHNTGEEEWYTPEQYIFLAREVLEAIELDPASSDAENKLDELQELVGWRDAKVGVRLRPGNKLNADRRSTLTKEDAEDLTGFSQQQVSKNPQVTDRRRKSKYLRVSLKCADPLKTLLEQ